MNRENLERATRHIRRAGERLRGLLERSHRRRRWESETAAGYTIDDLDRARFNLRFIPARAGNSQPRKREP